MRYRVLEPIGKGGMGEVFLAEDSQLDRKVALKFLPEALQNDASALARLRREAKSAASLDHPYICKVYEVGETDDGRAFIAMEYVDGETLAARVELEPLSPKVGVRIGVEIAEALAKAHEHGIVHRDLKPANVMLGKDGHVKVTDFGLAKQVEVASLDSEAETVEGLSRRGVITGTPGYMSPEQLRGEAVDGRSDLFALGVVLQEILTGKHPFRKDSGPETMAAILKESPAGNTLPPVVQRVVGQLLSKLPDERPTHEHTLAELQRLVERPELLEASASPERVFVGREVELRQLRELTERLRSGKGSLALIGGEPGVGKTRLSEEVLAFARREGFLALEGHCYEMEGGQPYLPWIESFELAVRSVPSAQLRKALGDAAPEVAKLVPELRRQYDDIAEPMDLPPEQQQRYLFNSIREFLARLSGETPIVWLLDDLHWADESTLLLLRHLLQKLDDLPILFVGTFRDVELDVGKPFEKVLAQIVRQRLGHRIALRRLTEASTAELLGAFVGSAPPPALVSAIYKETEGNPFFVEEVFQHLSEENKLFDADGEWKRELDVSELDVPEGVRLVIGRRLERLSDDAPKVLGAAAVMGRLFDLNVLENIGGLDPDKVLDVIEEAEAAKLVAPTSGKYAFTHELIRHTLVVQQSLPRRQRMHLRVADAIEKTLGARAELKAADIAHHLVQAGAAVDPTRAIHYLELSGDQALDSAAAEEALYFFQTAISLDVEDERQAASLYFKRALAQWNLGRSEAAVVDWLRALRLYEDVNDRVGITKVCGATCYPLTLMNRIDEGLELADKGLHAMGETRSPAACRLLAQGGLVTGWGRGYRLGLELIERAETMAETLGETTLRAEVLSVKSLLHQSYFDVTPQTECGQKAAKLLESTSELWWRADALQWMLAGLLMQARLKEAAPVLDELERIAGRADSVIVNRNIPFFRVMIARMDGALDSVEHWLERTIEATRAGGMPWSYMEVAHLGVLDCFRGRVERGRDRLTTAVELDPQIGPYAGFTRAWSFVAKAYACESDAVELVDDEIANLSGADPTSSESFRLSAVVEGLAVLGENAKAASLYPQAAKLAGRTPMLLYFGLLTQTLAGIAGAAGAQWDTGVEHFETALRLADEIPHKLEQPQVRYWYAKMLRDRDGPGDRDKARQLLGEALEAYESIDFPRHREMAKELLEQL